MRLLVFSVCLSNVIISSHLAVSLFLCVDLGVLQMLINDLFRCVVLLMCRFFYACRLCCLCVKQIALIHRGSKFIDFSLIFEKKTTTT